MADKIPIRAGFDGSSSLTGLAQFVSGDTIGVAHGGTGLATIGSNQLVTGNGTSTITSESNLTFDGTILKATGDLCATVKVVAPALCIGSEYVLPTSDGSAGQLICTDGSGALAFADAASSGHTIAEDGSVLASRTCLNFVGAAVTAADNSGTNATDVTVCATNALLKVREADGTQCCIALTSAAIGGCLQGDTSPTLGGNLDVNGKSIVSASNGNIPITPNGSGIVILDGICHPTADGSAGQVLCTNGSAALQWATIASTSPGGSSGQVQFNSSSSFGGSANLTWDNSNNRLGIGTASPDKELDVFGTAAFGNGTGYIYVGNSGLSLSFNRDPTDGSISNSSAHAYQFQQTASATPASDYLAVQVYDEGGTEVNAAAFVINGAANVGIGTATPKTDVSVPKVLTISCAGGAGINLYDSTNSKDWEMYHGSDNKLYFKRDNGAVNLLLDGTNVGIGTNAPDVQLHVEAGTDTTAGTVPSARFERTGASQTGVVLRSNSIDGLILRADSAGLGAVDSYEDLAFYTGATPGSSYGTVRMRIDSTCGGVCFINCCNNQVVINDLPPSGSKGMALLYDYTDNQGQIHAIHTGTEWKPVSISPHASLLLAQGSGKIGIATTSPCSLVNMNMGPSDGFTWRYGKDGSTCNKYCWGLHGMGTSVSHFGPTMCDYYGFHLDSSGNTTLYGSSALASVTGNNCAGCVSGQLTFSNGNANWWYPQGAIYGCVEHQNCCGRMVFFVSEVNTNYSVMYLHLRGLCVGGCMCIPYCFCAAGCIGSPTKNFEIEHPLASDESPNKYNMMHLVHSTLEGPEYGVYYRGSSQLDSGAVKVDLPEYFEALAEKTDATVQLTPVGGISNLTIKLDDENVFSNNSFCVCTDDAGNQTQCFHWIVNGRRIDKHILCTIAQGDRPGACDDGRLCVERWEYRGEMENINGLESMTCAELDDFIDFNNTWDNDDPDFVTGYENASKANKIIMIGNAFDAIQNSAEGGKTDFPEE